MDRCYIGCTYQAIDTCVKHSLRYRPNKDIDLSPEWMETVRLLGKGIYEAAAARARNFHRADAAAKRRRELLLSRRPGQSEGVSQAEEEFTQGKKRQREPVEPEGVPDAPSSGIEDSLSLVATSTDTSGTPRRSGRTRTLVTESTLWLTPIGARHEPPQEATTAVRTQGPTTTEEAIERWLELLGFTETPTESLPTVIAESVQASVQEAVQSMTPRAVGLMRRSLPLCLNAIQDEALELVGASASSATRSRDRSRWATSTPGRGSSERAAEPSASCEGPGEEAGGPKTGGAGCKHGGPRHG